MNRTLKATLMPALLAVVTALGVTGWWIYRGEQPGELALYFHPFVGREPLELNQSSYANPGGAGRFKVRDFQFFLCNIRLVSPTGAFVEPDSYHLVRFDGEEPGFVIVLHQVPRRKYQRIEFGIGVDPTANRSLRQRGDLDPNGRMAWNWEVGYKFVLFEGTLHRGETNDPLVYHVGFAENYRPMSIELHRDLQDIRPARLDFRVDLLRLFQGATNIDMAALSSVKFDRGDAALLGGNFAGMISLMRSDTAGRSDRTR